MSTSQQISARALALPASARAHALPASTRAMGLTVVALSLFASACTDPALHVKFTVPGRYRAAVTSSTLKILEPPSAQPFGCEDLAFSRVTADVVRLSTVLEVSARSSESVPLADLDRLSSKLLVADGRDEDGEVLVTGCVAVGEVDAILDAEIVGEPIAVITPPTITATAIPGSLTEPLRFEVRDRRGQSLSGIQGLWSVTGAGGAGDSGEGTSDDDGRLTIQPRAPAQAGPFFVSLTVRWGTVERAIVPAAATAGGEPVTLTGRALAYRAGRIGPTGEPGIVALVDDGGTRSVVFVYREGGAYVQRTSAPLGTASVLGILEELRDPPTSGRDRVIALDGREWIEVSPDGSIVRQPLTAPGLGFGRARSFVSATECRVGAPPRAMIGFDDGFVGVYGGNGAPLSNHFIYRFPVTVFPLDPLGSGCMDIEGTGPVRTYVLSPRSLPLYVITERNVADIVVAGFIALTAGIGFVPPSKANVGLLLGTQIAGNDFTLARARGRVTGTGDDEQLELVSEGSDPIPFEFSPITTTAGDLDGDGKLDVVSLFGSSSNGITLDTYQVWSYLALEVGGRRISGPIVDKLPGMVSPELLLIDLDRDTTPDIVVGDRPEAGAGTTKLEIFRLGS